MAGVSLIALRRVVCILCVCDADVVASKDVRIVLSIMAQYTANRMEHLCVSIAAVPSLHFRFQGGLFVLLRLSLLLNRWFLSSSSKLIFAMVRQPHAVSMERVIPYQ